MSEHSTDRLIRHLARADGPAARDEVEQIIYHLIKRIVDERQWAEGTTITGYQVSSLDRTGIPEAARWLR